MNWPLQENFLDKKSKKDLVNFITKNTRFTQFNKVREFEEKFSKWNGSKYSIFVNSGSSANLLIVQCAKELNSWKNGDEVIVPAVTWPTNHYPCNPIWIKTNIR